MGLNIGVDVDGVLIDLSGFLRKRGEEYFRRKYGLEIIDPDKSHAEEMFGCTKKQRKKFWWDCGWEYVHTQKCIDGSASALKRLREEGNRIVIITSRALTVDHGPASLILRTVLKRWLKRNGIGYDKLVFCDEESSAEDKRAACAENGIDVMVDDSVENLLAIKDIVRAICFDSPWNRELEDEGVIRAHDWAEVRSAIESMY